MNKRIPYLRIIRAARLGGFLAVAFSLWACVPHEARAQDCSRNMLNISGPQSYIATPDAQALHLTNGFTIECWARLDRLVDFSGIVDKGSYGIFLNADSSMFGVIRKTNSFDITAPANDSLLNWHHFAFVFTPGDSLRFYVDSSEVASAKSSILSIDSNTDSLRIGMSLAGASWIGSIDELRIWNVPRSLSEIKQTLFHTLAGNDSGLVLYYSFDDEAGSPRIHDFSGHGRDGFVRGASAAIVPSSSPIRNGSPGYRLAALESNIVIPTQRCTGSFDTVVHVRNLGSTPIYVDTVGFSVNQVFSIVPNSPFWLPPDSTKIDSLRLHFEPDRGGVYLDSLYISSSSDCAGRIHVGLEAAYDSVGLVASMDTVAFGGQTQCSRDTLRTITLRNTSNTDSVTILGAVLPPGSGLLVLDSFPIHLAKNDSTTVTIALSNGARGPLLATIAFDLDKCTREALVHVSANRQRDEFSMPDTIDFSPVQSSLAGVTRDTTVIVTNTGDVNSAIFSILSGPPDLLELLDPKAATGIYKAPGDTLQIHLRLHVNGCGLQIGKLQIQTAYCRADTSTMMSIYAIPPAPLMAGPMDMGIACSEKDTTIYISNPNDQPLRLDSIGYSTNFIFGNSPIFSDTIPAHGSIPVTFQFSPAQDGDYTDTVSFHSSPCGIGTAIFTGTWGYKGLSFGTSQLLFGRGCKKDSTRETVTLTNSTSRAITIASNTYSGSPRFEIDPFSLPIVLKPGASKTFAILYLPTLGTVDTGTFALLSPDGCVAASLALRGSREIANAVWADSIGEFDTICPGDSVVKTFDLANRGIDSIDVLNATVTGAGFSLVQVPTTFGKSGAFELRFTPSNEQEYYGTLRVTVDSCNTSFTLPLHGSGGPTPRIVMLDSVYDFDSIAVGDSAQYCFTLANPSCTPINLQADSTALTGTPFRIIGAASAKSLARGDTANLCVEFVPNTYGLANATLVLSADSATTQTIALRGLGLAPDVRFHPPVLDFGYVLHNSSETMMVYDTNAGNLSTTVAAAVANPFAVQVPAPLSAGASDSMAVTFTPLVTGLVYDTLRFTWSGHTDSVILRGVGTDSGLQLSAVGLDFGSVHVGTDSTLPLYLFARNNFPAIDSIVIQPGTTAPRDTFSNVANRTLPYTIQNDGDTLTDSLTYHARFEQSDTSYLAIYSGGNSTLVPLTGTGVEAFPWINPDSIPFPDVVLGTPSTYQPVQIRNLGGFPLYIDSIGVSNAAFSASTIDPSMPVLPHSARNDTVTFTPSRARRVNGILSFKTSYHDSILSVPLSGTGVYPANTGPSFGYSVASDTVEPGEFVTIPVSMNGIRLAKLDADSAVLDIRFDPEMVRMLSADGGTDATPVSQFTFLNDSTAEVTIARSTFGNGTIMRLHTEALLGPRPLTYIQVVNSDPTADQPEAAGDGAFFVADCGGAIHGVVFAGPYTTNAIVPNPAGNQAQLQFTLGLDGPVTVDVYNAIGQIVKHLEMGSMKASSHSLTLDVSDLPQGRYVYRLTSLEYHAEGAMVIMR